MRVICKRREEEDLILVVHRILLPFLRKFVGAWSVTHHHCLTVMLLPLFKWNDSVRQTETVLVAHGYFNSMYNMLYMYDCHIDHPIACYLNRKTNRQPNQARAMSRAMTLQFLYLVDFDWLVLWYNSCSTAWSIKKNSIKTCHHLQSKVHFTQNVKYSTIGNEQQINSWDELGQWWSGGRRQTLRTTNITYQNHTDKHT